MTVVIDDASRKRTTGTMRNLISALAWDGFLPLAVAAVPLLCRALLPDEAIGALAAVFAPIIAALIRSSTAMRQLTRICGGVPGAGRQCAIALAIVLLLLFEIVTSVLALAPNGPEEAWYVAGAFYAAYLIVIRWALRPLSEAPLMNQTL